MSREQLEGIAQEHQIKNIKKLNDEDLSFAILDAQAMAESLKPIERPKAKRGRPRKTEQPAQKKETKPEEPVKEKQEEKEPASKTPAKRTTKTKKQDAKAEEVSKTEQTQAEEPVKKPAAKRGRKPKSAATAEEKPAATAEPAVAKSEPEPAQPVQQEKPQDNPAEKPVSGKEFIHQLFDDLKDDPAAQADNGQRNGEDEQWIERSLPRSVGNAYAGVEPHLVALPLDEVVEAIRWIEPRIDLHLLDAREYERSWIARWLEGIDHHRFVLRNVAV